MPSRSCAIVAVVHPATPDVAAAAMTIEPFDDAAYLARWDDVRAGLDRFDAEALGASLAAWLADPAAATMRELRAWLAERLGDHLGDVAFTGLCAAPPVWRGDFDAPVPTFAGEEERRGEAVTRAVDAARAEADWLRRLAAIFDPVDGREGSVDDAVDAVIDGVMERTALEEAWYQALDEPLAWLADRLGRPRDEVVGVVEERLYGVVFSSWVAPRGAARDHGVRVLSDALTGSLRAAPPELVARAERVLRPARPRLIEARDAASGHGAQGALEALIARGLLDASWADPGARSLGTAAVSFDRTRRRTPGPRLVLDAAPPGARDADLPLLTLLAADAARCLRAEALAREALDRLRPFGVAFAARAVVWTHGCAGERALWPHHLAAHDGLRRALDAVSAARDATTSSRRGGATRQSHADHAAHCVAVAWRRRDLPENVRSLLGEVWAAAGQWDALAASDARLPDDGAASAGRPNGPRVRDLASPFDAVAALWDTGYGLGGVDVAAGTLVLHAPL